MTEELKIDKFTPAKAELQELANQYANLEIQGVEDRQGYMAVDVARKELKKQRVQIAKTGKELRAKALAFQKKVIATEKELIGIIEPVEKELQEKQAQIDEAKEVEKRRASLPDRIEKIEGLGITMAEDFLLTMDDKQFAEWFNAEETKVLEKRRQEIEERESKLREEQAALERAKELEKAREDAAKKAEEEARKRAEEEKARMEKEKEEAVQREKERAEKEKQELIEAQKRKEREEKERAEKEAKEKAEAEAKLAAQKKYQKWLVDNGYTEESKEEYRIIKEDEQILLLKKVSTYNLTN